MDIERIKESTDFQAVIESYLGPPTIVTTTAPGWHCPFHDDENASLFLTPDRMGFNCFGCGVRGDVVEFVERMEGVGFREAVGMLTGTDDFTMDDDARQRRSEPVRDDEPPCEEWQRMAGIFTDWCAEKIFKGSNQGIDHLHRRGLTDETIERWRLGWHDRARWRTWAGVSVYLPMGIVIPWTVDGNVQHIKMRLFEEWKGRVAPKYIRVKGGRPTLFGVDHLQGREIAVICESELDAVLLHQEAGDLVDVVAIGSKNDRCEQVSYLSSSRRWLLALDNDADDAAEWWLNRFDRIERFEPPVGNDITDFYLSGGDLRSWIQEQRFGPPCQFAGFVRERGWQEFSAGAFQ
jgi:DNA primase